MDNKQQDFDLNYHIVKLLVSEPFFSAISREIDKHRTTSIATAGVMINQKTFHFELRYNPKWAQTLTFKQKLGFLKHEFYHIMLGHLTNRNPLKNSLKDFESKTEKEKEEFMQEKDMWNVAMDLAINSHLEQEELAEGWCIPGKEQFKDLPPFQATEWYYKKLKENPPPCLKQGGGQIDVHNWDELPDEVREIIKEKIKNLVKKATKQAAEGNSWGTISNHMKDLAIEMSKDGYVPWEKELSFFVKKSQRADKQSTQRKINRKYPYIFPGKKRNRHANIAISVDESGSVSDDMLAAFTGVLDSLSRIATFTFIPFDYEVCLEGIFKWKKGEKRRKIDRVACGGTNFDAPTQYVNEHPEFDGHIILTDLCAPKPIPSRCQRIWMTTPNCYERPYFQTNEKVVVIKINKT
jgi:predicted metal-dependent peptidase